MDAKKHFLPFFLTAIFLFGAVYYNRHLFLKKSDSQLIIFEKNSAPEKAQEIAEKDLSFNKEKDYQSLDKEIKILIAEVQIFPREERFIELYNPNNEDIDLTGWYIQRKTESASSWNSFVSSSRFKGKTIKAKSHFLISGFEKRGDIVMKLTLTENNSLVLKNPKRKIIDLLGWGRTAPEFENSPALNPDAQKSLQRKRDQKTGEYKDNDNNASDFIIASPTPGSF